MDQSSPSTPVGILFWSQPNLSEEPKFGMFPYNVHGSGSSSLSHSMDGNALSRLTNKEDLEWKGVQYWRWEKITRKMDGNSFKPINPQQKLLDEFQRAPSDWLGTTKSWSWSMFNTSQIW